MVLLSFYTRCCLLGLALIGAAGLDLASGQLGSESTTAAKLDQLYEKITQLSEKVDDRLTVLAEDVKQNRQLIKDSTDKILRRVILCRMETECLISSTQSSGAGWIVVQQRFNGSVDFDRGWSDYRKGFGTVAEDSEFWWGLERLHQFTRTNQYELLMEFKDAKGEYRFARYADFLVVEEADQYKLKRLGGYSGTAGDINKYTGDSDFIPTGRSFSTHDAKNDKSYENCAVKHGGGWWYGWCGVGPNSRWNTDLKWLMWKDEVLHYTRMLIRPKAQDF